jgi:hypothetical protein
MSKPLIQIDDEIREMTDEELQAYEAVIADMPAMPSPE